jgi:hypothetical protein
MSGPDGEERRAPPTVSLATVKWGIGVALTILIFLGGALWSAGSNAATQAAKGDVLEARANAHDTSIMQMMTSVNQISNSVAGMRESNAAFQAEIRANLLNMKEEMERIRRLGPPGS